MQLLCFKNIYKLFVIGIPLLYDVQTGDCTIQGLTITNTTNIEEEKMAMEMLYYNFVIVIFVKDKLNENIVE